MLDAVGRLLWLFVNVFCACLMIARARERRMEYAALAHQPSHTIVYVQPQPAPASSSGVRDVAVGHLNTQLQSGAISPVEYSRALGALGSDGSTGAPTFMTQ